MNELKNTKSDISISINKATDIYILKKEDLIKYCKSKKLNPAGKSADLRSRLSRYIKGALHQDDIENTLSNEERIEILNKSIAEKIDLDKLANTVGLPELSPEPVQANIQITNKSTYTATDNLELFDNLNNSVNLYSNKIQDIFNSSKANYSEFQSGHDTSTLINFENTTVTLEDNNTNVNKGNKISNTQPLPILDNPKMFNQNSANKYMVIKADSFSGQGDIQVFFKQYEKAAEVNNWDDKDKIKFLSIFLKDTANTFLENLENIKKD